MNNQIIYPIIIGASCAIVSAAVSLLVNLVVEKRKNKFKKDEISYEVDYAKWQSTKSRARELVYRITYEIKQLQAEKELYDWTKLEFLYNTLDDFLYEFFEVLRTHNEFNTIHSFKHNTKFILDMLKGVDMPLEAKKLLFEREVSSIVATRGEHLKDE